VGRRLITPVLIEEHDLKMFENKLLKGILGPGAEKVMSG
jgi:hypothetical protein